LNDIYAGRIVWNKVRMISTQPPASAFRGRTQRINTARPRAPHLRIVDAETWQAAQAIKGERHRGDRDQAPRAQTGISPA